MRRTEGVVTENKGKDHGANESEEEGGVRFNKTRCKRGQRGAPLPTTPRKSFSPQ